VIGFVFGDVKPFGEIVHAHIRVHDGEPFVVALFELGEIFFARFVKDVEVVVEIVAFEALRAGSSRFMGMSHFFLTSSDHESHLMPPKEFMP